MQPYFFPYIGYWQMINAVDKYVIFDDVNYIKRGWINRNRILYQDNIVYFGIHLHSASQNKHINEINVINDEHNLNNPRIIKDAYQKAPYFSEVYPVIEKVLLQDEQNLAEYNGYLIRTVCEYLGIKTDIIYSSDIDKNQCLKGQDKIIEICKKLGASSYYNAIGGRNLYEHSLFENSGLELKFLQTEKIEYKQFDNEFAENLSIIDVMMFNSKEIIRSYLSKYEMIS